MHQVLISASTSSKGKSRDIKDLLSKIAGLKSKKDRVYETSIYDESITRTYIFATTSKDTFLLIGSLGEQGQCDLAGVLAEEFWGDSDVDDWDHSRIVLSFESDPISEGVTRSFLVVRTVNEKERSVTFTFSPAH